MPRKPAGETKAKATKEKRKPKHAAYPPWKEMITKAIVDERKRNGSSRQAIAKYIIANYPVEENVLKIQLKLGLRRMLQASGDEGPALEQHKGSFKLAPDYRDAVKKTTAKKAKQEKAKTKKEKKEKKEKKSPTKKSPSKSPRKSPSKSPKKSPRKGKAKEKAAADS